MQTPSNHRNELDFSGQQAFFKREQSRDAAHDAVIKSLVADAKARGVTGLRCDDCGTLHSVHRIGDACNAFDADGELCGCYGLSEVKRSN